MLVSIKEYRETQEKADRFERLLEMIENMRLLKLAENRSSSADMTAFEDFVKEAGFTMKELEELAESVEIE